MILLTPEKSFQKRIEKWCMCKDFIIVNALERHGDTMAEFGNKIDADELNATPTLAHIAKDPDSKESKIKKQHLSQYLDRWLTDEAFQTKVHYLIGCILKNYATTGEDTNVFVVLRPEIFNAYHLYIKRQIEEDYGVPCVDFITRKMSKADQKAKLNRQFGRDYFKMMSKAHKRLKTILHIEERRDYAVDDDDIPPFF